jgi:predicted lipoprotein
MLNWKRTLPWCIGVLIAAAFCRVFPPFHIVRLNKEGTRERPKASDPATFARQFWEKRLLPAADHATDLTELLPLLSRDGTAARSRFGRSPGISSSTYFFIKGSGQVKAVSKESVQVAIDAGETPMAVELVTGLLFGNIVRDSTGFLDVSAFPNSQEFNAISTELNRRIETEVLPPLRERAQPGKAIRFAGCLELEAGPLPAKIAIVPIKVEWP